jgi:hypothetical protein
MEHSISPALFVSADGEVDRVGNPSDRVEADDEGTNKQRRKVQNRKNQRARRGYFPPSPSLLD